MDLPNMDLPNMDLPNMGQSAEGQLAGLVGEVGAAEVARRGQASGSGGLFAGQDLIHMSEEDQLAAALALSASQPPPMPQPPPMAQPPPTPSLVAPAPPTPLQTSLGGGVDGMADDHLNRLSEEEQVAMALRLSVAQQEAQLEAQPAATRPMHAAGAFGGGDGGVAYV